MNGHQVMVALEDIMVVEPVEQVPLMNIMVAPVAEVQLILLQSQDSYHLYQTI